IDVHVPHSGSNINSNIDLIVYTAAIAADNPELVRAKELGITAITRSEFLGHLMNIYKNPICVAGTHGKTTTTSMLSEALIGSNLNPTITVGGILKSLGGNIRIGGNDYFVTEACEYCDSFLNFFPKIGIILNIEEDHMDYFKDIHQIRNSFLEFGKLIPSDGFLAINSNIDDVRNFSKDLVCTVETFGLDSNSDWYAQNIVFDATACPSFDVYYKGSLKGNLQLHVHGMHNVLNALSVCAVCNFLNIDINSINKGISTFTGADQRFEIKGTLHGITIVDDYAHHPTEIAATLSVAKNFDHKRLFIVFQPHTYTRTKAFLDDFANILSQAENVIVTDIYAAREKNPGDIQALDIVNRMDKTTSNACFISDFNEITDYLLENCLPGDLIILMGAGNVNQIADILLGY
ncbi:MAG: UDP-N-acetylmuramate--L-alanine ligase, partial [Cellulosilyticaceae bacterium]